MCGICGIYQLNPKSKKEVNAKTVIERMNQALAHRGPDGEGSFVDQKTALGHRRLAILDLSRLGHQPMFSADGRYIIVFNGEVYNYLEIREELIAAGYKFKSDSDTEVILASYDFWGRECVSKFNGMWAFAIYDQRNKSLFCSRDRLGIKPFYYFLSRDHFVFASEIKAILEFPLYRKKPNNRAIYDFLAHAFSDHDENTFFEGVKQLLPGHSLEIKGNRVKITKYWALDPQKKSNLGERAAIDQFRFLFEDSVRLRLRSDVPIGTCLSGGLDSSAIVGQINQLLKSNPDIRPMVDRFQKTFSCIYSSDAYQAINEKKFIDQVVSKTHVHPYFTDVTHKNLWEDLKDITFHQDAPSSASSVYAQWLLYARVKQEKVKVMLDGQGSDEMLGGYVGVSGIYLAQIFREFRLPSLIKEYLSFRTIHPEVTQTSLARIFSYPFLDHLPDFLFDKAYRLAFNSNYTFIKQEFFNKYFQSFKIPKLFGDFLKDFNYWMVSAISLPAILRSEDRNSMASGVEARVPFLDYRLVEFIFSLKNDLIVRDGKTKYIQRHALKNLLPKTVYNRHDKIGFDTPEKIWLQKYLRKNIDEVINSDSFKSRPFFDREGLIKHYDAVMTGKKPFDHAIWRWISLEMWFRVFMD